MSGFQQKWEASLAWITGIDRWLLAALAIGFLLGVQGLGWGRYDCLNLDRMAFKSVSSGARGWMEPATFRKPPLYTYVNFFLSRQPAEFIGRNLFWMPIELRKEIRPKIRLFLARVWNLGMFAGLTAIVFCTARTAFGVVPARVSALLLGTAAGFVPYQIFLTTDLAVTFLMMAVLACAVKIAQAPTLGISIAAGLLAGLCVALKYNGLGAAICLPLAHLLAGKSHPFREAIRRPSAWLCGLAIPVGFLLGNPYSLLRWEKFRSDFLYNYTVTPVYDGVVGGSGYLAFLARLSDIFGWPGLVMIALGLIAGVFAVANSFSRKTLAWQVWLLAASVFLFYFWKIGSFPRMETRFVLPVAPILLLMAAAGFGFVFSFRKIAVSALSIIVLYNVACGIAVGGLFRNDPRMKALAWADQNLPRQGKIESSESCPLWNELPGRKLAIIEIDTGLERKLKFQELFAGDGSALQGVKEFESAADLSWFTPAARALRNPQWIAWNSLDVEQITRPLYDELFLSGSEYRVVFDAQSPELPAWAYPQKTEFVSNRMTIWEKNKS